MTNTDDIEMFAANQTGLRSTNMEWLILNRGPLTIFAHANTGEDLADHTQHVIWFGPSEPLDLSIFG